VFLLVLSQSDELFSLGASRIEPIDPTPPIMPFVLESNTVSAVSESPGEVSRNGRSNEVSGSLGEVAENIEFLRTHLV